jgi:hypothetical protein
MTVDYATPAELYPTRRYAKAQGRYRRFASAADAVRYAIEEMPRTWLVGTFLDVDGDRFDDHGIRALYDAPEYPLQRHELAVPAPDMIPLSTSPPARFGRRRSHVTSAP